jgi:hypothetical protein
VKSEERDRIQIEIGIGIEIDSRIDMKTKGGLALTDADFDPDSGSDFEESRAQKPTRRFTRTCNGWRCTKPASSPLQIP